MCQISASRHYWRGRKPLEREALARAFVAKAVYRHPTTSDLIRALQSAENLRRVCGFVTVGDIPNVYYFLNSPINHYPPETARSLFFIPLAENQQKEALR